MDTGQEEGDLGTVCGRLRRWLTVNFKGDEKFVSMVKILRCWLWMDGWMRTSVHGHGSDPSINEENSVLAKMESCFKDLISKTFQWEKKDF